MSTAAANATSARKQTDFGDPVVWAIAAAVAILHLAFASRYDFFRNELYFIICGRHPDFGYVDQPPLVPLIAAATQMFGDNLFLLRLPAALAAAALIPVTAAIVRLLGGSRGAMVLASVAVATAPGFIAITSTLGTESFEPLGWTLCAYFVLCAVLRDNPGAFIWAGLAAGISLEAKYGIAIWMVGLLLGVLISQQRELVASRGFGIGAATAVVIGVPSVIWQALHDWPFLQIIGHHAVEGRHYAGSPIGFMLSQVGAMNVVLAPLWVVGLVAPFFGTNLKTARVFSIAFTVSTAAVMAAHGKDYYLFPAFPALFAAGAVALQGWNVWLRGAWIALAVANTLLILPVTLPVLSPEGLHRYLARTHLAPRPNEAAAVGSQITQVFSDEMPWRNLESRVAGIYRVLTPDERKHAGIFTWNYGEAAAIDFFGRADGLPPALSGQNQYFLWGTHGFDGSVLIIVNGDPAVWTHACRKLDIGGRFGAEFAMPYENDRPIYVCRGLTPPLDKVWSSLKWYR